MFATFRPRRAEAKQSRLLGGGHIYLSEVLPGSCRAQCCGTGGSHSTLGPAGFLPRRAQPSSTGDLCGHLARNFPPGAQPSSLGVPVEFQKGWTWGGVLTVQESRLPLQIPPGFGGAHLWDPGPSAPFSEAKASPSPQGPSLPVPVKLCLPGCQCQGAGTSPEGRLPNVLANDSGLYLL